RGVLQSRVGGVEASAGQCDVPAPRVIVALGAFDQEQFDHVIAPVAEHDRTRGPPGRAVVGSEDRRALLECAAKPSERWMIDERRGIALHCQSSTGPPMAIQAPNPSAMDETLAYPICCSVSAASAE